MPPFFKKKKVKKLTRFFIFLLFFLLQFSFLLAIFLERTQAPLIVVFLLVVSLLLSLVFLKTLKEKAKFKMGNPIFILYVTIGAALTYYLNTQLQLGAVISAAAVGLGASFFSNLKNKYKSMEQFPAAVYCGAFVGMSDPTVAESLDFIVFAAIVSGLIYIFSAGILNGFGGKLGTIAFGGVAIASFLLFIFVS